MGWRKKKFQHHSVLKYRGPILRVTSSETRSICAKQTTAKFEYLSLIGQCRSLGWSRDTFLIKLRLYEGATRYQLKFAPGIYAVKKEVE